MPTYADIEGAVASFVETVGGIAVRGEDGYFVALGL